MHLKEKVYGATAEAIVTASFHTTETAKNWWLQPLRELVKVSLEKLIFDDLEKLPFSSDTLDIFEQLSSQRCDVNRALLECGEDSIMAQSFGNKCVYCCQFNQQSREINQMYYIDFENRRAANVLSIDPTIVFFQGKPHQHNPDFLEYGYSANWKKRCIYVEPHLEPHTLMGHTQSEFESQALVAITHEIGHILEFDWLTALPHTFSDRIRKKIALLYKYGEARRVIKHHYNSSSNCRSRKKGSSSERFASYFSLRFARICRDNKVDFLRGINQQTLDFAVNEALHDDIEL